MPRPLRQGEQDEEKRRKAYMAVIEHLRDVPNVTRACRLVGVNRNKFYRYKKTRPDVEAAYQEALLEGAEVAELELWRRGVEGVDKPVTHKGQITAWYKEYSDNALFGILNARHPLYDRTKKVDITSGGKALPGPQIFLPVVDGEVIDDDDPRLIMPPPAQLESGDEQADDV